MEQFIKGEFDAQDKLNKNFKEIETSLSDKANNTDNSRATTAKDVTGAINELNSNMFKKSPTTVTNTVDVLTLTPGHYTVEGAVNISQNYPYTSSWEHFTILVNGWCGTDGKGYKTILLISCSGAIFRNAQTWETSNWSGWKQLGTTEVANITLLNGWVNNIGDTKVSKNGNQVTVNLVLANGSTTNNSNFANLPVGFRPSVTRYVKGDVWNSSWAYSNQDILIAPDGNISFSGTPFGNSRLVCNITFTI